jgi:tetratricopeptide (TPR) repeat protein
MLINRKAVFVDTAFFITFVRESINVFMKKVFSIGYILGMVLLFSACTTLQYFSFERLQAADVSFPEQVRSVGVVNGVPSSSGGDGKVASEAFAQEIAAANYFNQVVICDSALQAFDQVQTDSLIQALEVDMLFAIERVEVELQKGTYYLSDVMTNVPVVDGIVTPLVCAYIAGRDTPLFSISKTDTICWELRPDLTEEIMRKEASEYAAKLPMPYLLPSWKEVERYYFDGGNVEMRDAGIYVREGNWEEAGALWQNLYDTKKGKAKMRAAYNLALYYEMQDDFEKALAYMETASSLASEGSWEAQLIAFYQLKLQELSKDNHRLKVQMKRFEP